MFILFYLQIFSSLTNGTFINLPPSHSRRPRKGLFVAPTKAEKIYSWKKNKMKPEGSEVKCKNYKIIKVEVNAGQTLHKFNF